MYFIYSKKHLLVYTRASANARSLFSWFDFRCLFWISWLESHDQKHFSSLFYQVFFSKFSSVNIAFLNKILHYVYYVFCKQTPGHNVKLYCWMYRIIKLPDFCIRIDPDQNLIVLVGNALVLYIHVPTIFICSVLILQMLNVLFTDLFSRTFLLFFSKQHKTFKIKWYCLCIKEYAIFLA